jgi:3-hydroxyacyl-CoA dehydrogenase
VPSDRPGDVDVIFLRGYGWPAYTGGPLFFADRVVTLPLLLQKLLTFARTFPATAYYQPAPLLVEMVKRSIGVLDLQRNPALVASLMNNQNKSFL